MKYILILSIIITANHASAASFNCDKATNNIEHTICNNPPLNEADTELGNVYKKLRASLSDEESILLRNEQRLWLKQRTKDCSISMYDCLLSQISSRTQELNRKLDIKSYEKSNIPEYTPSYTYRSCETEMPSLACSPENKEAKAIAMCAMVMGGCELVTRKLPESTERYAAGQICGVMVSQLSGQEYDVNAMLNTFMFDVLSESAEKAINDDNVFVKLFIGAPLKIVSAGIKTQQVMQCINQASQNCTRVYNKWKNNC